MKIELISVSAVSEGAEMLLTLRIDGENGNEEKRKLLIFTDKYLELGLHKGSVLDGDAFDKLETISKECVAIRRGGALLSYSPSSKARLARRLRAKGIDSENASRAADHLEKIGLIDERADVEREVRACLKKLWGKKRIYRELIAKGYQKDDITSELENIGSETMTENCVTLFKKKHKSFPKDPEVQKKIIASLARYGYTFAEIKCALEIVEAEK